MKQSTNVVKYCIDLRISNEILRARQPKVTRLWFLADRVHLETGVPPILGKEEKVLKKSILFLIFLLFLASNYFPEILTIFHAGSLTKPLNEVAVLFKKSHPDLEVRFESSGSLIVARKITELGKIPDIALFADYRIFTLFLFPDFASFQVRFASNSMVLAFTENSRYSEELNDSNWFEIIFRPDVKFGYSNPDIDPCGYRALMVCKLAEKHYGVPNIFQKLKTSKNALILKKSVDLVSYLQLGELDYAFLYRSEAVSSGLKFIEFPAEINLAFEEFKTSYKNAVVEITGKDGEKTKVTGEPIYYSFTVPVGAQNRKTAVEFLKFLLSKEGKAVFKKYGFIVFEEPIVDFPENLPEELKGVF
ncbi:MAG: molybdate/tungstate transport system substrate-binding protein [Thermotogaceae bacterium]|nr:molybdate/tungstate transport system substrate-binding protein [Thermotogaceae bacterium]